MSPPKRSVLCINCTPIKTGSGIESGPCAMMSLRKRAKTKGNTAAVPRTAATSRTQKILQGYLCTVVRRDAALSILRLR
jgi:hypothetical protein